jgi:hypothetical protein
MAFGSRRWADWAAAGALLAAVLALFAPALPQPDAFLYPTFSPYSDLTVIHWPKAFLMAQTWQATGTLPLWTPANLSGMPLAANQLAMRFYPPAWLLVLLPLGLGFNLLFVFHLFWGGLGTYQLLRAGFDLDAGPALAGALTFALGGKLLAHTAGGHVSLVGAMAWMPWAMWGGHMLIRQRRLRWAVLAAVALAMQIATHSLITLYTVYFLAAWQIVNLKSTVSGQQSAVSRQTPDVKSPISNLPRPARRSRPAPAAQAQGGGQSPISNFQLLTSNLPRPAGAIRGGQSLISILFLAAWLGAVQLLPLAELSGVSNRALSLAQASEYALTPLTLLVGLLLPNARGGHEVVIYWGLVPTLLACFGLSRADKRTWFLAGAALLAAVFALGTAMPLFELVYRLVPGFSWVRTPARVFLPASLAVAILAGLGMQRLLKGQAGWSTPAALVVGALTLALGLGLAALFGQVNRAALGLALFPALTLLVAGLAVRRRLSPRLALAGLALLVFADLASFDATLIRFVSPAAAFADGQAVAAYLAGRPGLFRVYSPSYSLPPYLAAGAGLQTADGVEPVHLAVYDRFMALAGGYGDASFSVTLPPFPPDRPPGEAFRDTRPDLRLLGLLNVEYLAAAFPIKDAGLALLAEIDGVFIYRNAYALPRAWIASPVWVPTWTETGVDWAGQLAALADLGARSVVEGKPSAAVTHYAPDRIEVEASLPEAGLLVLAEIWYPGWQVTVDGQPRPVEQVVGILRGVSLDAGTHQVVFVYRPASVSWGTALSLAGWAAALVFACVQVARGARRRRGAGGEPR